MERLECTDRQFVGTCPIVTGYWDWAVGMYRQTVCRDMSHCDWLLRWSGWIVQTDSLYGHVQLWLATEIEHLECTDRQFVWPLVQLWLVTEMERLECTDKQFVWTCQIVTGYWDGAVGMYRQTVCMATCPIVTGYWDGAVGMYRQAVCMDMSNCDWLLRWSGWNVQTDSL